MTSKQLGIPPKVDQPIWEVTAQCQSVFTFEHFQMGPIRTLLIVEIFELQAKIQAQFYIWINFWIRSVSIISSHFFMKPQFCGELFCVFLCGTRTSLRL